MKRFALDSTRQCRTYSKGNRQKVVLIAALVSDVELFILDEPTSGLDPLMEATFRDALAEIKRAGKTTKRKPLAMLDKQKEDQIVNAVISAEHGFAKQRDGLR